MKIVLSKQRCHVVPFSQEQKAVCESPHQKLLVLAGPGTGKTHCLVHKVLFLIKSGVVPSSILVVAPQGVCILRVIANCARM